MNTQDTDTEIVEKKMYYQLLYYKKAGDEIYGVVPVSLDAEVSFTRELDPNLPVFDKPGAAFKHHEKLRIEAWKAIVEEETEHENISV